MKLGTHSYLTHFLLAALVATLPVQALDHSPSFSREKVTVTEPRKPQRPVRETPIAAPTTIVSPSSVPSKAPPTVPAQPTVEVFHAPGCFWVTSDGSDADTTCITNEIIAALSSGVRIIGTHGSPGHAQCLPVPGELQPSCGTTICSICYGAAEDGDGVSVNDVLEEEQDIPCEDIIACTGTVAPVGRVGSEGCSTFKCSGTWVDACEPANVVAENHVDGICLKTATPIPSSTPTRSPVDDRRHLRSGA